MSECFPSFTLRKLIDPARIRNWNPLIRSQVPYPLGHGATHGTIILFAYHVSSNLNAFEKEKYINRSSLFLRAVVQN